MDPMNTPQEEPTQMPEPEVTPAQAALDRLSAAGFDRSQADALKAALAKVGKSDAKTMSGSEAPQDAVNAVPSPQPDAPRALTGRDVDWSEYNLDFNVRHLYPKAVYRDTPEGPKWVCMVTEFRSTTKDFRNFGKRVNAPGAVDKEVTEALNLGEFLNDQVNGRDQWKIAAVMPTGSQCGLLLEREVPFILPDPLPLKQEEEVDAPTEPALVAVEEAALDFMKAQEGLDIEPAVSEDSDGPITLRPIEKGTPEHEQATAMLDESGALASRVGEGVARALATARAEEVPAPTAGVIQPEAVVGNELAVSNVNPEGKVAAAGYSAAQDLLRALNDPNFRASLPTEE